jgi:hypothetical protein
MTYSIVFALVATATVLWLVSKWWRRKRIERRLRRAVGGGLSNEFAGSGKLSLGGKRATSNANVSPQVRKKLMRLLGNHQPTVDRLIEQARWKNPGESEQWYWEKVLYDLERDRWR